MNIHFDLVTVDIMLFLSAMKATWSLLWELRVVSSILISITKLLCEFVKINFVLTEKSTTWLLLSPRSFFTACFGFVRETYLHVSVHLNPKVQKFLLAFYNFPHRQMIHVHQNYSNKMKNKKKLYN